MVRVTRLKCDYADRYTAKRQPTCGCLACVTAWADEGGELHTLGDFWDACRDHDWFHEMSDDSGVHERGRANMERLKALAAKLAVELSEHLKDQGDRTMEIHGKMFEWEEIKGKGRCLVPVRDLASLDDIVRGRRFRCCNGWNSTLHHRLL